MTQWDPAANDGSMASSHGDVINWHNDRGALGNDEVRFVLRNESTSEWTKAYKLRIGGGSWWVQANFNQNADNGAYFGELPQTSIEFHKPQFLGAWGPAGLRLDNFDGLTAGDIVTFTWVQD